MTAPDKIWADPDHWIEFPPDDFDRGSEYTEYTRTATIPALLAEARAEGIREAAKICNENRDVSGWVSRDAILALIDAPAPAPAQPSVQIDFWGHINRLMAMAVNWDNSGHSANAEFCKKVAQDLRALASEAQP